MRQSASTEERRSTSLDVGSVNWMEGLSALAPCSPAPSPAQLQGGLHGAQLAAAIGVPSAVAGVLLLVLLAFFVVGHARRGLQRRATGLQKEAEEADDEADMDLEQGPSVWRMLSECIGRSAEATVARTRQSIDIAPGVGLDTTLLLSDVQNSTALWYVGMLGSSTLTAALRSAGETGVCAWIESRSAG